MRGKNAQRVYLVFGVGLAVVMALSLFAPALTPNTTTNDPANTPAPTSTVPPTVPAPITDFSGISFTDEEYLHPSGLFTVSVPTGWQPSAPANSGLQAQASLNNPDALSVIEASLQQPAPMPDTLDALSAIYTRNFLSSSWRRYASWEELSRRQDTENDRLLIDFQLTRQGQTFLARQASWYDDDYVYMVRVVVTDNMIDLMNFMLDEMVDEIRVIEHFVDTPLGWNGFFSQTDQHIIRYPQTWQITDQAINGPTSIESGDGTSLRVEAASEGSIAGEDAATEYVTGLLPGVDVISVQPVERNDTESGFAVAYSLPDPDGVPQSGLAVLLNGVDGQLHVASGLVRGVDVDFNDLAASSADTDPEATAEAEVAPDTVNPMVTDFATVMETFSLLTGLNLPEPEPEPTPTPVQPVITVTPDPAEATEEPAAEATEEAATEATEEAAAAPEATEAVDE